MAGGIKKKETSRQAVLREIHEELGVQALSVKKIDSLIIAPDCLEEITDIYLAEVPIINKFKIINSEEGEYIDILPLKKKEVLDLIESKKTQNIVTKFALLKIRELKL